MENKRSALDGAFRECDNFGMSVNCLVTALAAWVICCAFPTPAQAYLDAGTGSMILQMVIATVAAGLFILKTQWRRLKAKLFGPATDPDHKQRDPQPSVDVGERRSE